MHERPIGDLVDALRQLGARIEYLGKEGFPPLALHPAKIETAAPVRVRGDVSSQYLSAMLMALPLARTGATLQVEGELISKPYVEITLNLMRRFGVDVAREGWNSFAVPAGSYATPGEIRVEGDASSASYFLAAGAISGLTGGGPVRVEGVGRASIQGDLRFAEALQSMGASIAMGEDWIEATAGPQARDRGKLKAFDADFNHIPDAAMTAAIAALFADGPSTLRNIASWRVKETDRIAAMAAELRKLGATVVEGADFIEVTRPARWQAAAIHTYDDHRIAMCFSLAAFNALAPGAPAVPVRILDPQCVGKTFPAYFETLFSVAQTDIAKIPVLTIDGPTASGKGTVASAVAQSLGYHFLDSGAVYRATALATLEAGVDPSDEDRVAAIAASLDLAFGTNSIRLAGVEVADRLREEAVGSMASEKASVKSGARAAMGASCRCTCPLSSTVSG